MDRLTAEEALAHPYMADYSFPLDEPVSLHPFHIEDEVDDILLMDQSHSHTWDRYVLCYLSILYSPQAFFHFLSFALVDGLLCTCKVLHLLYVPADATKASCQRLTGTYTAPTTQMKFRLTREDSLM